MHNKNHPPAQIRWQLGLWSPKKVEDLGETAIEPKNSKDHFKGPTLGRNDSFINSQMDLNSEYLLDQQ